MFLIQQKKIIDHIIQRYYVLQQTFVNQFYVPHIPERLELAVNYHANGNYNIYVNFFILLKIKTKKSKLIKT